MNRTQEVFDSTASTYNKDRSKLIPGCDTLYRWTLDLIPANVKNIVDLGAGSGLLTQLLRERFPDAHIHLIDFSEPMLSLARARFGDDKHVTYHHANYVTEPLPERVCTIASSLSIHHLEDDDKRIVFKRVHAALIPGGVFVNAEHVGGSTPSLEARYQALWLQQVRAAGATEEQIAASLYRQQEDRRSSVEDQLLWMREAGFTDVDCWYKENSFAVMAGTKS
jgi:tRNA (cmo5U34)-methyltransferase